MDQVLEGKVAIITGGAGGIGSVFGRELGRRGAAVVLADLDGDGARKQAEGIVAEGPSRRGHGSRCHGPLVGGRGRNVTSEQFGGLTSW